VQQNHRLRVGLVENPPWVIRTVGEPSGAEVELIRRFATAFGLTPEWFWGSEQSHMEALQHYELDLVIGGLENKPPWSKSKTIGITRPYFTERMMVGVPASAHLPLSLAGAAVATRDGEATAAYLIRKGARPIRLRNLGLPNGPVAAPDWRLEKWGVTESGFPLQARKHVMAVPPGENGWLRRLEDFLHAHQSEVKALLQKQESDG
jgi:polar amino acid transport system substrate-binding protein